MNIKNDFSNYNSEIASSIKKFHIKDLKLLNELELEMWNNKKKFLRNGRNWVIGRVSAKYSISKCLGIHEDGIKDIQIKKKNNGVPYLDYLHRNLRLSISHCNGWGFSCSSLAFAGIGCDVEKVKDRHLRFGEYFLNRREQIMINSKSTNNNKDVWLTSAWSCKEACYKCIYSSGDIIESLYDINLYSIPGNDFKYKFRSGSVKGECCWYVEEDYIMSVATII